MKKKLKAFANKVGDVVVPISQDQYTNNFLTSNNVNNYVQWYSNSSNQFPRQILDLYLNASVFSPILQELTSFAAGHCIESEDESLTDFLNNANTKNESFQEVFKQLEKSLILSGNAFAVLVYDSTFQYVNVFCEDFLNCRIKYDEAGNKWIVIDVNGFNISTSKPVDYEQIPCYPNYIETNGYYKTAIHFKQKEFGFPHYSPPYWIAGLKTAKIPYKTTNWNLSRIEKGFAPDGFYLAPDIDDISAAEASKLINNNHKGEDNAGGVIVLNGDGKFELTDKSFEMDWTLLHKQAEIDIFTNLRFPMSLMGRTDKGFIREKAESDYVLFKPFLKDLQRTIFKPLILSISQITNYDYSSIEIENENPFEVEMSRADKHAKYYSFYTPEQQAIASQIMFDEAEDIS